MVSSCLKLFQVVWDGLKWFDVVCINENGVAIETLNVRSTSNI